MRLADVSIRRPVFAVMLIGSIVVLGTVSISRLGIDLWPRVELPMVVVTTVLEGASPDTVEREVSLVLEEEINTIEGIRTLRSMSSSALSIVYVEFGLDYEIRTKAQEVRDAVAKVRGELPRDVEPPVIARLDPDAAPVLAVILAGSDSIRTLSEFADKRLKPKLERIPGVGSVSLVGDRKREIRVWIDPLRLGGYGLTIDEVLAALEREHVELPGGRVETAHREWVLRTEGKLTSADQFGSLVVTERGGRVIHLRDVATVEDGMADERTISRLNGRRGVALQVRRQSGENTVAVVDALRKQLDQIRTGLPTGYEMLVALDASRFIRSSIRDVILALFVGGLLASFVVFLFLHSLPATVITALAIPCSILGSFGFFYYFGFSINTMTLMALSLSIGLLIDDAIVVAVDEVGLAVIATSFSLCAVFVPIAFMSGVVGRFFREFGIVATSVVLLSTLVALTLVPMLSSLFQPSRKPLGASYRALGGFYAGVERSYRRVLKWGLAHRSAVVALALAAVVGGVLIARTVPVAFMIASDSGEFNVWLKLPLGSSVYETQLVTSAVETTILEVSEVQHVFSTIGAGAKKRVNEAIIFVQLIHKSKRVRSQQEVASDLRAQIG
ncbi:MAG: efflux RND transporter permease subunit, partial [Deltaproteobacteria bacterium]|nr:efflux RND transporter permease subunit [Deltaproteobacteria bacterium]